MLLRWTYPWIRQRYDESWRFQMNGKWHIRVNWGRYTDRKKNLFPTTCVSAKLLQLCPTLCNHMDGSCQVPLFMGFPRQEYWSRLMCPPPGDLPVPGIEPKSPVSPALQVGSWPLVPPEQLWSGEWFSPRIRKSWAWYRRGKSWSWYRKGLVFLIGGSDLGKGLENYYKSMTCVRKFAYSEYSEYRW